MKKTFFLMLMIFGYVMGNVQAESVELVRPLEKMNFEFMSIFQTDVSQYEAEKVCLELEMSLPTARELAWISMAFGAEGISETKKEGYELVKGTDRAGNLDLFYFSNKGYDSSELEAYWIWSSSIHPDYSIGAYGLDGHSGDIYDDNRSNTYGTAVLCVLPN